MVSQKCAAVHGVARNVFWYREGSREWYGSGLESKRKDKRRVEWRLARTNAHDDGRWAMGDGRWAMGRHGDTAIRWTLPSLAEGNS